MLDFLLSYWKIIVAAALLLFDVVLLFLNRRKPLKVYDSVHQSILYVLPDLIKSAENSYAGSGQGSEKLSMVLELLHNYLCSVYGMSTLEAMKYDDFVKSNVEKILATPQKKGE